VWLKTYPRGIKNDVMMINFKNEELIPFFLQIWIYIVLIYLVPYGSMFTLSKFSLIASECNGESDKYHHRP